MESPAPSVVFLDVGDTLIRAHPSWSAVYRRVLQAYGVEVAEPDLRAALERVFRTPGAGTDGPFEATQEGSYRRLVAFDARVLAELGHPPQPDPFYRELEAVFGDASAWWVFEDTAPALTAMRRAGIRLCVISNWGWALPELLHTLALVDQFEGIVTSARVGYEKPHRAIFEHALRLMDVDPSRAMHVGDSPRADVAGARAAGIAPVLIARGSHAHGLPVADPPDVPVVADLYGLLDLIGVADPVTATAP